MADKSISGATTITNLAGTEKLPVAKAASVGDYNTTTQDILNIGTITAANAAASSNGNGVGISLTAGAGDGSGGGGGLRITLGDGGTTGWGGYFSFYGGNNGPGSQYNGGFYVASGHGAASSLGAAGGAGAIRLAAGNMYAKTGIAGDLILVPAAGQGDSDCGNLVITLPAAPGAGKSSQITVNNDPSVLQIAKSWFAGEALNGRTIYTATRAERVTGVIGRVDVANGGAATLVVVKCASGVVPGSGVALTSNSMNLAGAPATNQTLALSATAATLLLAAGDSLVMVESGVLGTSVGCITVHSTPQ